MYPLAVEPDGLPAAPTSASQPVRTGLWSALFHASVLREADEAYHHGRLGDPQGSRDLRRLSSGMRRDMNEHGPVAAVAAVNEVLGEEPGCGHAQA